MAQSNWRSNVIRDPGDDFVPPPDQDPWLAQGPGMVREPIRFITMPEPIVKGAQMVMPDAPEPPPPAPPADVVIGVAVERPDLKVTLRSITCSEHGKVGSAQDRDYAERVAQRHVHEVHGGRGGVSTE